MTLQPNTQRVVAKSHHLHPNLSFPLEHPIFYRTSIILVLQESTHHMAILLPDFKVFIGKGVGYSPRHQAFKDFISMKVLFLWVHLLPIGHHQCCNSPILVEWQPTLLPMDPRLVHDALHNKRSNQSTMKS